MEKQDYIERAKALHESNTVIDAHFDLLMDVMEKRKKGRKNVIEEDHLPSMKTAGLNAVVSSLFVDNRYMPEMALRIALDQVSALYGELDDSPSLLALCVNWKEAEEAMAKGKLAIFMSFEGIEPLLDDLSLLRVFYELGVRGVGLAWSRRNYGCDGCFFSERREGQKGGLTDFGVEVLDEIMSLGMFLDVSHLNDQGFDDVLRFYGGPFLASHSNCRKVMESPRNLTDRGIKALAVRGGVMGMNCCSQFVAKGDAAGSIGARHLADHVDHVKKLVGIDHVGFGFDFCDIFRDPLESSSYDCIGGYGHAVELTAELLSRGYSDGEAIAVMGGNLKRFYKKVLG